MGIVQAELSRQIERQRRRISAETPHFNMTSVWTFAGVLLLPPVLMTALVVVLYAHLAVRSWFRLKRTPVFRTVFNASLAVITNLSARGVLVLAGFHGLNHAIGNGWAGFLVVLLGSVAYFITAAVIAIPGLRLQSRSFEAMFGSWGENGLEFGTLGLGAVTGVVLVAMPQLSIAIVPAVLLIQRGALVTQLEIQATTDDKTGVFNTAGWHHRATTELARAAQFRDASVGVLMIDLDHFKRINDEHGHLAGDEVLKRVAETITAEVRRYDSVGRFGGEEFVVLLPGTSQTGTCRIAERIREAITAMTVTTSPAGGSTVIEGVSVSIGVAMYPTAGLAVDRLLHAADTALYLAKSNGRNMVVTYPIAA
jgi:diguanylate cyclase (GGDEF)-like protein